MPHRTRILDGEAEYLVVEESAPSGTLRLRLCARAGNPDFTLPPGLPEYSTEQGTWQLLAVYEDGELRLAGEGIEGPLDRLGLIVRRYQHERAEEVQRSEPPYYYLLVKGRPLGTLHASQPGGLMLLLFREEEDALASLRASGQEGTVAHAGALAGFLALRAEEGYAGALLDQEEPVFWCLDEQDQLVFLKLQSVAGTDEFEGHLLHPAGRWSRFEGREDLEFVDDQDRWDDLMIRALGRIPFLGYEEGVALHGLFDEGQLVFVEDSEEGETPTRMLPLFHDPGAAAEFARMHDLAQVEVTEVQDLRGLLRDAAGHGAVARLQPDDHRARGGALWVDGDQVVLDSFSGFWRSRDLRTFERVG